MVKGDSAVAGASTGMCEFATYKRRSFTPLAPCCQRVAEGDAESAIADTASDHHPHGSGEVVG